MQTLRIFVSSPGDVAQERALTETIIDNLQGRFMGYVKLQPIFWEHEPLLASSSFQDQIMVPSQTDIVVCILWSRLGTRLPPNITRTDGSPYASGTEFEFEDAIRGFEKNASPALLVYHKTKQAVISLDNEELLLDKIRQKKALDQFLDKWFTHADGSLKSAFHRYESIEAFESKIERHLQILIEGKIKQQGFSAGLPGFDSVAQLSCPYRGLATFDAEHRQLFFGRTREIHEIIDALRKQAANQCAFLLILGASGSGKSSLIQAGVIPMLMRPGVIADVVLWRQAVVRPGDGRHGACHALIKGLIHPQAVPELLSLYPGQNDLALDIKRRPGLLDRLLRQIFADAADDHLTRQAGLEQPSLKTSQVRLVLFINQFEELFTAGHISLSDRQQFIALVDELAAGGSVWVIATLRSDFYGHCAELTVLNQLRSGHGQYDLLPPKAAQVAQMIRRPALFGGLIFEKDPTTGICLDEVLLDSASNNPNALPLLSFTLEALYNDRTAGGKLTFAAYQALGGLEGALAKRAEETFARLDHTVQNALALPQLIAQLVQVGTGPGDIASCKRCIYDPEQSPEDNKRLIEAFIAARLFVSETSPQGQIVISIAHEALIAHWPRLQAWVSENRLSLQLQQRIAAATKEWLQNEKDPSFLFGGNRLAEAEHWFGRHANRFSHQESLFVQSSIKHKEQHAQAKKKRLAHKWARAREAAKRIGLRNRWLSAVGLFAAVLAVLASGLFFQSEALRAKAVTARNQADDLVNFIIEDLSSKLNEVGRLDILGAANEQASAYLAQQSAESLTPDTRLRHIKLSAEIGFVQEKQGHSAAALQTYQKMLKQSKSLVSDYPDAYEGAQQLILAHFNIGGIHWANQAPGLALSAFLRQQSTALTMLAQWPDDASALNQLGQAYANVGAVYESQKEYDKAFIQIQKSIAIGRRLLQQAPQDRIQLLNLADNYLWLGKLLKNKNRLSSALEQFNQARQIYASLLAQDPQNSENKYYLAVAYQGVGLIQLALKQYQQAKLSFSQELAMMDVLVRIDSSNVQWQIIWSSAAIGLAQATGHRGEYDRAEQLYNQSIQRLEALVQQQLIHANLLMYLKQANDGLARLKATVVAHNDRVMSSP